MKKIYWIGLIVFVLSSCEMPIQASPTAQLPFASLTPLVATDLPIREKQDEIDNLNKDIDNLDKEVAALGTEIADLQTKIAQFQAQGTQFVLDLTPTITPTRAVTSTPSNVMTVVALQKLNLRWFKNSNAAGRPIMLIFDPRVQYFTGDTFQVLKPIIQADGGDRYYEVVGPRGAGLFVRLSDVDIVN